MRYRLPRLFAPALVAGSVCAQLGAPAVPPENPISVPKAQLGKALFWEEQLSSTRTTACGTCHIFAAGGSDPRVLRSGALAPGLDGVLGTPDDVAGSAGVIRSLASGELFKDASFGLEPQVTARRTPSVINAAFASVLFWDGRAEGAFKDPLSGAAVSQSDAALEIQATSPPLSSIEMAHDDRDWSAAAARVESALPLALAASVPAALEDWIGERSYPELFDEAFGSPAVTPVRILQAIATYERTLVSDQAPFDGGPTGGGPFGSNALSPQESAGLQVFLGQGNCVACHPFNLLSDNQFHNIGVRPITEDPGRGGITGQLQDQGAFRTPGLRNVELRAPYFHTGSVATLAEVIDFYNRGGDFHENQDPFIQPLGLSDQQQDDLLAFLTTGLLDERVAAELPPFDRPTLYTESDRAAELFGSSSGGARQIAVEPPQLGNPSYTLGLDGVTPGLPALLGLEFAAVPAGVPVGAVTLYLGFGPTFFVVSEQPSLAGPSSGDSGYASVSLTLPASPAFAGVEAFTQWVVLDPSAPGGLVASEALRSVLF